AARHHGRWLRPGLQGWCLAGEHGIHPGRLWNHQAFAQHHHGLVLGIMPGFVDVNGRPLLDGVLPEGLSAEEVMRTKVKHYPFSTSDASKWLKIAAKRAMLEGRVTPLGGFRLDLRGVDENRLVPGSDLAVMWPV